jgi:hypothetical protein
MAAMPVGCANQLHPSPETIARGPSSILCTHPLGSGLFKSS